MNLKIELTVALVLAVATWCLVGTTALGQSREFVCSSEDFRFRLCSVERGARGQVRLIEQLSESPCRRGHSWGHDRRGVWVDQGCSARFAFESAIHPGRGERRGRDDYFSHQRPSGGVDPGSAAQVVCKSEDFNYRQCRVEGIAEARLVRQLSQSPCRQGRSWGYNREGIWVDDGCAATFKVLRAGGDGGDDGRSREISCASPDFAYRLCETEIRGRVSLLRQSSESPCIHNRTWGYDRNGIWVDDGCAARFRIDSGGDYFEPRRR